MFVTKLNQTDITKIYSVILIVIFVSANSCGTYSYTSKHPFYVTPTISISNFNNKSDFFDPNIGLLIVEALQKRFQHDLNVELVDKNADIIVRGNIIDYQIKSTSLLSPNAAQTNSLSITVILKAEFLNDSERNLNKKFTDFVDFNANKNFAEVNDSLDQILSGKLADQIYYEIAIKW